MSVLRIRDLWKTFVTRSEKLEVLRGVNMDLEQGATAVVCGESGSGKSTLLNLVGGLDVASGGEIVVEGRDICGLAEEDLAWYRSRYVGYIFQFHYLLRDFTAVENVMMPAHILGRPARGTRERARELLNDVGLWERRSHYAFELSGGERQRTAVARALMNDPALILADEPTGNLDERNSDAVARMLFSLVEEYGKTMVLVSHDRGLQERGDLRLELVHGELSLA